MDNEFEGVEEAGPQDLALRNSPIVRSPKLDVSYNCWYNGKEYSNGALLCMVGELFQCSYGVWVDQSKSCGQKG